MLAGILAHKSVGFQVEVCVFCRSPRVYFRFLYASYSSNEVFIVFKSSNAQFIRVLGLVAVFRCIYHQSHDLVMYHIYIHTYIYQIGEKRNCLILSIMFKTWSNLLHFLI